MTGGPTEVHILYPKRSQLQYLSTQKNHYFLKHTQKYPLVLFSQPPKNPSVFFRDPKKSRRLSYTQKIPLWPNFRPQKITRTPPDIKICEWGHWDFAAPLGMRFFPPTVSSAAHHTHVRIFAANESDFVCCILCILIVSFQVTRGQPA